MRALIAGNWKMYKTGAEAETTLRDLASLLHRDCPTGRDVLIFAPFTALGAAANAMREVLPQGMIGAQDVYPAEEGAFTGEISPRMIAACGAKWVLTGHSERRHILGENDELVGRKTVFSLAHGLNVTLCIGEKLEEREAGQWEAVLERQLRLGLVGIVDAATLPDTLAIAYEPVWAIGTGKTATSQDILDAHAFIRLLLKDIFKESGPQVRILYGGSVKPDNASAILGLDNVDGVLVGGASLQAEIFNQIVTA